ncbi:MAG: hypothetical protein M0R75_05655 [Dehalococcoidia bacterium]|nr:hypothetical protein [Dehalococcoidia bacterium]
MSRACARVFVLPASGNRAPLVVLALLLVILGSACAASDPPPTSPLDETTPTVTQTPPPPSVTPDTSGTVTPGAGSTPASDAAAEAERITGEAITRLAEWMGIPETELRLTKIEGVEWPDACLGVQIPSVTCAKAVTPGYRVTLHHVAMPDVPYLVHVSKAGRYAWAPSHGPAPRVVASVDPAAGTVTLERVEGEEDKMGTLHRAVPGSYLEAPLADLQPGQRVEIGTAPGPSGSQGGLIVSLVPIPS